MKITAILPISRTNYLDRILESLEKQTQKPNNLIVIYDGHDSEYLDVRNRIVELKYDNVICVQSNNRFQAYSISERRRNIVNIHNQIREIVEDCDYIFSIEDDGIIPANALERLINDMKPDTGIVTGVELGRWGIPYVGAWLVDDVHKPQKITSLENKSKTNEIEEIDGCGLYCALIRTDLYKSHEFFTDNGIGPDVNLGLYMRQQGYKNYIDWSIHVTHVTHRGGMDLEISATSESRIITLRRHGQNVWGN